MQLFLEKPVTILKHLLSPARTQCFGICLLLAACGGDSTSTPEDNPDPNGPVVDTQTPDCKSAADTLANTQCPPPPNNQQDDQQGDQQTALTLDNLISDTVAVNGSKTYRVPAGAEIILTTTSGDADLYLYRNADLSLDNRLCYATESFREDNCASDSSESEVYAEVYGAEASSFTLSATTDCSVASVNQWVYRNMKDYYLFADQVPDVNPADYSSASDLVRDIRNNAVDPYSSVRNAVQQEAFFEAGTSFGFGYNWDWDTNGNPRVIFVFDNGPMGQVNINRGDIISSVNGIAWTELTSERYSELVGTRDNPLETTWSFIDGVTGESKSFALTRSEYTANTVLYYSTFTHPSFSGKVGYIVFNDFLRISEAELDNAIDWLNSRDITELVLDLRYNPGGFTSIARKLASQIGGPALVGETLVSYQHNNKYTNQNFERQFESVSPVLDLDRVVVLTTNDTASSSELVINALRPYMEVITIGDTTEGKAFISSGRQFCGQALNAMKAKGVNAAGVSVEGGIAADCYATDDRTRNFGRSSGETEGMLLSSLDYLVYGTCDAAPFTKAQPVLSGPSFRESSFPAGFEDNPKE
jgi:C-terminal processing protease CtpA/Prc